MATKGLWRVSTYRPSYKQVSDLTSDTVYSYTAGVNKYLITPGDIIEAGGFRYSAVASDATDYDIENANGVRLVALKEKLTWDEVATDARGDSLTPEGETVRIVGGGEIVKAASDATDSHLTNSVGAKFYEFTGQAGLGVSRWLASANTILALGDSLTAGSGGSSYLDFLAPSVYNARGFGGEGFITARTQRNGIETLSSSDPEYPYAPTFDGVRNTDWQSGDFVVWDTDGANWDTARIWYLKQSGGGQFQVEHSVGSVGTTAAIDTSHTGYELAYYDFAKVTGGNALVKTEWAADGKMCIFGVQLICNDGSGVVHKIAKGGMKAEDFSDQDETEMTSFYSTLDPDLAIVNLGRNDIGGGAAEAAATLAFTQDVISRLPSTCDVLVVGFNACSDDGTTNALEYKRLLRNWAIDQGYGYVNDADFLGNYSRASARGFMGDSPDGVHPGSPGNGVRALNYSGLIGLPFNAAFTLPSYDDGGGAGSVYNYSGELTPVDPEADVSASGSQTLWTIGLTNGNPLCILKVEVWGVRIGTSGWRKQTHYIRVSNGTTRDYVTSVGTPQEAIDESEAPGAGTAPDWTLSASIVSNLLEISVTETAGYDTRFAAACSYRFPYLGGTGVSVYEH